MKTIGFLILPTGEVSQEDLAKQAGVTDQESATKVFGEGAEWLTITVKDRTNKLQLKVRRESRDPVTFRIDEDLMQQKRFVTFVESWSRNGKPSEEAFLDLEPNVSNAIDEAILAYCYPSIVANPAFFQQWSRLQTDSETESESS